jgi:flagellar motor switch protein FliN
MAMAESQEDIDALLADVSQLAAETAADIVGATSGEGVPAIGAAPTARRSTTSAAPPAAASPPPPKRAQVPSSQPQVTHVSQIVAEDVKRILQIEVPVIVRLAERSMPMSKILALSTGSIIEFEKPSDGLLNLMINNKCVGHGQAVKVGENFGLRVTVTGSVQDRIEALGPN